MIEKAPPFVQNDEAVKWLFHLQHEEQLEAIQNDYLYWDKIKYKFKSNNPEERWNAIKYYRRFNRKTLTFGTSQFSLLITNYMHRALHRFDLHLGGNLGSNIGIAETDKTKFIISSITEEAIASSQMEGANTTRQKAKEMIQKEQKPKNKSEQMILNNFIAMKHIVQHKTAEITPEGILSIHKLISNKTLNNAKDEGKYRDNDDVLVVDHTSSEIVHTPPPAKELNTLIRDLCTFCNTDTENFIHPIVKGCIIHFMIGWIHPFTDGNGRTARALFYWYMLKQGYWLVEFLSISKIIKDSKTEYEKAYLYTEIDENDLSYFITYHIKTLEKTFDALKEYINRKQKEVFQAARFLKIPHINERMAQILKLIFDDPERIFTTKEIESRFTISNFTARADLKNLVEHGFLEAIQVNKKKQNFIKAQNFETIIAQYL